MDSIDLFYQLTQDADGHFSDAERSPLQILERVRKYLEVDNIAYLVVNMPSYALNKEYIVATYSPEWVKYYVSNRYVNIDPVIEAGLHTILPIDWRSLNKKTKKIVRLFSEAQTFGIGNQGLSIPIRGAHGEIAIFSFSVNMNNNDFDYFLKSNMKEMQIISHNFHTKILSMHNITESEIIKLSEREKECLKWAAAGKSSWETGIILNISQNTVNFFLEQCRVKLSANTKTHAVAKAIRLSLI